jgi:hypothetical protein
MEWKTAVVPLMSFLDIEQKRSTNSNYLEKWVIRNFYSRHDQFFGQ